MNRFGLVVIGTAVVIIGLFLEATISSFIATEAHRLIPSPVGVEAPHLIKPTDGFFNIITNQTKVAVMVRLIFTVFSLVIGARIMLARQGYEEHHRHFAVGLLSLVAGYWLRSVA